MADKGPDPCVVWSGGICVEKRTSVRPTLPGFLLWVGDLHRRVQHRLNRRLIVARQRLGLGLRIDVSLTQPRDLFLAAIAALGCPVMPENLASSAVQVLQRSLKIHALVDAVVMDHGRSPWLLSELASIACRSPV